MPEIQYWSNLEEAWEAIDTGAIQSPPKVSNGWMLIKGEPRVRVILLEPEAPHNPVVIKIYRTPGLLTWRTIVMVSRANREFTALMEAHRRGLPVVRPHCWMEDRWAGGVRFSAIVMEMIDGQNLEHLLKNKDTNREQRMWLARQAGILLGQLHRGGLYWATAVPRNILLQRGVNTGMLAIDMPYAQWHGHDLTGSGSALQDLRGMLRCKNQAWRFTSIERKELLMGYCEDQEAKASALEPLAKPRTTRQSKFERIIRRSVNVLAKSPGSPGCGGSYQLTDRSYQRRNSQIISVE